jgi:hypothetical protein
MKTYWVVEVERHAFLTSALEVGEWSASRSGRLTPEEIAPPPGTHGVGAWVDSRPGLGAVKRKIPSP